MRPTKDQNACSQVSVPLPNEVPPPPDLSSLPSHILHSGTVETLIGQNDDLIARLKVNIRRNSLLEQQLVEHEKVNSDLTRINSSLVAQIQVFQEKERTWSGKQARTTSIHENLRSEMADLKTRAAELSRLKRYHRRVRLWVAPFIKQLKAEISNQSNRNETLTKTIATKEVQVSDLRSRLQDSITHFQNQTKIHARDQAKLVEKYETTHSEMASKLEKISTELKVAKEKAEKFTLATSQAAHAQNRIVFLERRIGDMEKSNQSEISELQSQISKYRSEAKVLAVETIELDRRLSEADNKLKAQTESYSRLQDQFESLQTIWADSRRKLETMKHQHESLNQINQELSSQLLEIRQESSSGRSTESTSSGVLVELNSGLKVARQENSSQFDHLEIIETADSNAAPKEDGTIENPGPQETPRSPSLPAEPS